ncbi:MAG: helix-hairpin-helix domain-containing protein, partial [Synergistaceae bacterium]|nr:helix-hairpin-helix domain-containing protein [Synergistaceae bacterium]
DADIVVVNMAQPLFDGQHVHVPARGEIDLGIAAPAPPALAVRAPGRPARRSDGRIDINRATAEELTQLKGVGPLLAERIVEHRERHGPFDSVEDLLQVRGIGTSKLKGLRDRAIVAP